MLKQVEGSPDGVCGGSAKDEGVEGLDAKVAEGGENRVGGLVTGAAVEEDRGGAGVKQKAGAPLQVEGCKKGGFFEPPDGEGGGWHPTAPLDPVDEEGGAVGVALIEPWSDGAQGRAADGGESEGEIEEGDGSGEEVGEQCNEGDLFEGEHGPGKASEPRGEIGGEGLSAPVCYRDPAPLKRAPQWLRQKGIRQCGP